MRKASKKLLSLILAVVMVVTSCSVGFTAFAAEKDNAYWNNNTNAEKTFDALNDLVDSYVPTILGIQVDNGGVKKTLGSLLGMSNDEISKATIGDVVADASPMLLGLLGSVDILKTFSKYNIDKKSFLMSNANISAWNDKYYDYYSYLDAEGSTGLTFYDLYSLCNNNKDSDLKLSNGDTLGEWCTSTLAKLKAMLEIGKKAVNGYANEKNDVDAVYIDMISAIGANQIKKGITATEANYKASHDSATVALYQKGIDTCNEFMAKIGVNERATTPGEALLYYYASATGEFHTVSANSPSYAQALAYIHLAEIGGKPLTTKNITKAIDGTTSSKEINTGNYAAVLGDLALAYANKDGANLTKVEVEQKSHYYFALMIAEALKDASSAAGYHDIFTSDSFEAINKGILVETGYMGDIQAVSKLVKDSKISSEQLAALYELMKKGNITENSALAKYLLSDDYANAFKDDSLSKEENAKRKYESTQKLSSYAISFITDIILNDGSGNNVGFIKAILYSDTSNNTPHPNTASSVNAIQNYIDTGAFTLSIHGSNVVRNNGTAVPVITYVNDIMSGLILRNTLNVSVSNEASGLSLPYNDYLSLSDVEKIKESLASAKKYNPNDYNIPNEAVIQYTNILINNLVGAFFDENSKLGDFDLGKTVNGVVNDLLESKVVLYTSDGKGVLNNIWINLYNDPVNTVFNLVPILAILLDEVIVPYLFNAQGDVYYGQLDNLAGLSDPKGLLYNHALANATFATNANIDEYKALYKKENGKAANVEVGDIIAPVLVDDNGSKYLGTKSLGISTLSLDLNKILPSILAWLDGDKATAVSLVGKYTVGNTDVPKFTGIYTVDKALYGASLTDVSLPSVLYAAFMGEDGDKKPYTFGTKKEDAAKRALADGLTEFIKEIAHFAKEAVNDYLAAHKNDSRYAKENSNAPSSVLQSGLNNVFVALPSLIDAIGQKFITKYGINSDWTYTYSGKFTSVSKTFSDGTVSDTKNKVLEDFKSLAGDSSKGGSDVLAQFVDILIGNWINALLDILNDTLQPGNELTNRIELVAGLLNSLGGFGETSIISDVLNGFFDLTRKDDASFALSQQNTTNFVGFSQESGLFLLSNIQFSKNGEERGLIPLIMGIKTGLELKGTEPKTSQDNKEEEKENTPEAKPVSTKVNNKKHSGTDYSKLLSNSNTKAANELITKVDAVLKSLLANTSLNEFTLTSNENILAGVLTTASNYLGSNNVDALIVLIDKYLECFNTTAVDGNVNKKDVYSDQNLSEIVIGTYQLVENIVAYLFYDGTKGLLRYGDDYHVITGAIDGIVSPSALAIRIDSEYSATANMISSHVSWRDFTAGQTNLKFGVSAGDKKSFYKAMGYSLSGVAAILSAVLTASTTATGDDYYSGLVYPVLNAVANHVGASGVLSHSQFKALSAPDQLTQGIITPLSNILTQFYDAPATFLMNVIASLGDLLNDKEFEKIVVSLTAPINSLFGGVAEILGDYANAPSLVKWLKGLINDDLAINIKLPSGSNKFVNLLNGIKISDTDSLGSFIGLAPIDWAKLSKATPGEVVLLVYNYAVNTILGSDFLRDILGALSPELEAMITKLTPAQLLTMIKDIIGLTQSPTEVYWTFKEYANKITGTFSYPKNITAAEALQGVENLDALVQNVFPLLKDLGVLDQASLQELVNDKLFTNEILTKLAVGVYGALDGALTKIGLDETAATAGLDFSPAGIAAYLTDKSYGKTYSSAASTLKKAKNWNKVKTLNWGFKNGSAKAETGFINGLAAILRPFNDLLTIFLAEGKGIDGTFFSAEQKAELAKTIKDLSIDPVDFAIKGDEATGCKLTLAIKKGVLSLTVDSNMSNDNSVLKCDLGEVVNALLAQLEEIKLGMGTNGYESAVVPLLEAFICKNVKTYKQYISDYNKAKDNLLIDILKPVFGLVDDVLAAPADTLTKILPNVAYFIDSNGLAQAVGNLLAPITAKNGLMGILKKNGLDVDKLIKAIAGKPLGKVITDALGIKKKFTLNLNDLSTCNLQDIIIPLVNSILKKNGIGIRIPDIDFALIASHGTIKVVKSAAMNTDGEFKTRRVIAKQGEVFVAFLRYVADVLIKNATAINKLLANIDAIKKNDTIKKILTAVFGSIRNASKDDIVRAVFYFLTQNGAKDAFFDYSNFTYKNYDFSFGDMDEDFCRQLAPMLDGLVGGLLGDKGGLLGLIEGIVYKDEIISKLATGLYGAIEGVKVGNLGSLTNLLAKTDIDFSTANVASLLTNEKYGKTYPAVARKIASAGSWKNVKADSLKWGVTDRASFLNALCAVLRPIYGVLDVLLNNGGLNLFNIVSVPGSDGYTSFIVPLLEAFGVYNIKTQYNYREDIFKAYDAILLDILNPLLDKVEDILNAPIEMLADILPNLSLFFANDGLLQLIDNLLTPVSALLNAVKPIINVNTLLDVLGVDLGALLGKIGLKVNVKLDVYDLQATLKPLIGAENVVTLLNGILGIIKIGGKPLGLELPEIDWFKLASHGEYILDATSQVATIGSRIAVKSDQDETLIAVLRFLIDTINYKDNYNTIINLVTGLLGDGVSDSISGVIDQVLSMLKGDADTVIKELVDLLQQIAG